MKDAAELDRWRVQGEDAWFNYGIKPDGIELAAYFDGTESETERVVFIPHKFNYPAMDLKKDISLEVLYNLEDTNATEIVVYLGLDNDGDGVEDARIGIPLEGEEVTIRGKKLRRGKIGSDKIRELYPEALGVTHLEVSLQKKRGVSFVQPGVIKKFLLKEVRLKARGEEEQEMVFTRAGDQYRLVPYTGETLWKADFSLEEKAPGQKAIAGFEVSSRNAAYYGFQGPDGLHLQANFPSTIGRERHVLLRKKMPYIDLKGYPYLRLDYHWPAGSGELEDMIVEIKGRTDKGDRLSHKIAGSRFLEYPVDLWQELKASHNGLEHFFLDEIGIYLGPFAGQDVEEREIGIIIKKMQLYALNRGDIQDLLLKTMVADTRINSMIQGLRWEAIPLAETDFIHKQRGQDHYLKVFFKGDGLMDEGVILEIKPGSRAIPLEDIKSLSFDYRIDNPKVQGILILPVLTDEGQREIKVNPISFMHLASPAGKIKFDLQGRIRQAVSHKSPLYLKGLRFYLLKSPGVNCRDNRLTGYYTFALEDLDLTTTTTTLFNKILRQAAVKVNGKRYSLVDGDIARIDKTQVIKKFLDGSSFDLGRVDLRNGTNRIEMLPSDYCEVELAEISTPGKGETQLVKREEPGIGFRKINPTRYVVDAEAGEPFWLVFSESFHEGWKAYVRQSTRSSYVGSRKSLVKDEEPWSALVSAWADRGKRVELAEHHMVNGYANGWYVPLDQIEKKMENGKWRMENGAPLRFQIVLEYKPQRLFEIGVIISSITLISCLFYLIIDFTRRRFIKRLRPLNHTETH